MYYQDDFSKAFQNEMSFHEYLAETDGRAQWIRVPAKSLYVLPMAEAAGVLETEEEKRQIRADTRKHTGLLLQTKKGVYPLGTTAIGTLKDRARIKGTALLEVKTPVFAGILNECLKVAKGNALLRFSEGKVRGTLSGDEADYAIISMPELFMIASAYIHAGQNARFVSGYADHSMAQVTWQLCSRELAEAYGELMEEHGKKPFGEIQIFVRVTSSDVGASGANIFISMLDGGCRIILGEALRIKHQYKRGLEEFAGNMESLFQYYRQKLKNVGRLCDIPVSYPVNTLAELMKSQGFGKKLAAETVERFKTVFGEGPCSAYEVYCGLCESVFFAKKNGSGTASLVKLEEKIARCLSARWHDYDIPGGNAG